VVMILVALVIIASAAAAPLFLRQLNRQRSVETQKRLETAFRGLFPGKQRKTANMWFDFGYSPTSPGAPPANWNLSPMVLRSAVATSDATHAGVAQFTGSNLPAWNGPYWQGSIDNQNRPVDAWGRPIQLRYISTSAPAGWQTYSLGANGISETGDTATPAGDDQVYPNPPYMPPTCVPNIIAGSGWQLQGIPTLPTFSGSGIYITVAGTTDQRKSAFWPQIMNARAITAEFDLFVGNGLTPAADGITLAFADADQGMLPTFRDAGDQGGWDGAFGMKGYFIAFDTWQNAPADPAVSGTQAFVALSMGATYPGANPPMPAWIEAVPPTVSNFRGRSHHVKVVSTGGTVRIYLDGSSKATLTETATLPLHAYIGFTGSTGQATDDHWVGNVQICTM